MFFYAWVVLSNGKSEWGEIFWEIIILYNAFAAYQCLKFSEETVVPLPLLQNIMFQCGYCELIFNDYDSMAAHEKGHERNIDDEDLNSARYFLKILTMVKGRKIWQKSSSLMNSNIYT